MARCWVELLTEMTNPSSESLPRAPWKRHPCALANLQLTELFLTYGGEHPQVLRVSENEDVAGWRHGRAGSRILLQNVSARRGDNRDQFRSFVICVCRKVGGNTEVFLQMCFAADDIGLAILKGCFRIDQFLPRLLCLFDRCGADSIKPLPTPQVNLRQRLCGLQAD